MRTLELCKKIGIENYAGLERFKQEMNEGETLLMALERYYQELGGEDFRIMEGR